MNSKSFLAVLLLLVFASCSREVDSNDNNTPQTNVERLIGEFYKSVTPMSKGETAEPEIKSVSRQTFQIIDGKPIEALGRAATDDSNTFDMETVEFALNGKMGYAVLSDDPRIDRVFYFTENGSIQDTAYIEPLKELIDTIPYIAAQGIIDPESIIVSKPNKIFGPVVKTQWGQGYPYNMYATACDCSGCSSGYYRDHNPVGCVTTATAQVMAKLHKFPHTFYGTKMLDFKNLPQNLLMTNEQAQAIGHFFHEIALCCQIKFNCGGSSGTVKAVYQYLKDIGYKCEYVEDGVDLGKLESEIINGCPHLIGGHSSKGGHMWIIDGVRIIDGVYGYHCNWGWDGQSDGWTDGNPYTPKGATEGYTKKICNIYIDNYEKIIAGEIDGPGVMDTTGLPGIGGGIINL